jgi:hypothetical protein
MGPRARRRLRPRPQHRLRRRGLRTHGRPQTRRRLPNPRRLPTRRHLPTHRHLPSPRWRGMTTRRKPASRDRPRRRRARSRCDTKTAARRGRPAPRRYSVRTPGTRPHWTRTATASPARPARTIELPASRSVHIGPHDGTRWRYGRYARRGGGDLPDLDDLWLATKQVIKICRWTDISSCRGARRGPCRRSRGLTLRVPTTPPPVAASFALLPWRKRSGDRVADAQVFPSRKQSKAGRDRTSPRAPGSGCGPRRARPREQRARTATDVAAAQTLSSCGTPSGDPGR